MAEGDAIPLAAAATPTVQSLFNRRIDFHPARKTYSPISSAGGDFSLETLNPGASAARPSANQGPPPPKGSGVGELCERGLDPELSFKMTFRRIGAGLQNLGNTCFLNSVLQCLTYTEPFAAYLQSGKHKSSCHTAGFCAMCALQNHVMHALQSTGKIVSPSHLVRNLRCVSQNFRNSRQEDAHEYMVNLLESMHKCCLPSGVPSESPSAYEKSLVHKIFGGHLRSQVKCTQCSYSSNKYDPFLDLSLEIGKADSLLKALKHFTASEQLDGGERQYHCQRCKEKVRALKQLSIHKPPYVLTIHLKRFSYESNGHKIDKKVDFEPALDLKPFVSDLHEGSIKYTLYGVLVHAGYNTHSGHYFCFIRTSSGMWHSLDDNKVTQVSEKTVFGQKAYMLFYVRDRSSGIKRLDDVHKDNVPANGLANKVVSPSGSSLNGSIQNSLTGKNISVPSQNCVKPKADLTTNGCSATLTHHSSKELVQKVLFQKSDKDMQHCAKPKADPTTNGGSATLTHHSSEELVQKEVLFQKSDKDMQKEAPSLENNHHASENRAFIPQSNAGVLSKGLQQTTLPKDLTESPSLNDLLAKKPPVHGKVDLIQMVQSKDSIAIVSHSNEASENVVSNETSKLSNGCQVEVKSANLVAQTNHLGIVNLTSLKHTEKFLAEKCMHEDASIVNSKGSGSLHYPKCGESLLRLGDNKVPDLPEKPIATDLQKEAVRVLTTDYSVGNGPQAHKKHKKLAKCSLVGGMNFGRKKLFLSSLSLQINKNHRRCKKRRAKSRNIRSGESPKDTDQVTSTSETTRVSRVSIHVSKKRSHSKSRSETNTHGEEKMKKSKAVSVSSEDRDLGENSGIDVTMPAFEPSKNCSSSVLDQCDAPETDAHGTSPVYNHDAFLSLLTRGFKETTVAGWDNSGSELFQPRESQNDSIGYVLDEWDEELDRGRQKKVKKPRQLYDGANLFQETANMKAQQRMKVKMDQTRSANQPLRI